MPEILVVDDGSRRSYTTSRIVRAYSREHPNSLIQNPGIVVRALRVRLEFSASLGDILSVHTDAESLAHFRIRQLSTPSVPRAEIAIGSLWLRRTGSNRTPALVSSGL